jgi:hypothetical protein
MAAQSSVGWEGFVSRFVMRSSHTVFVSKPGMNTDRSIERHSEWTRALSKLLGVCFIYPLRRSRHLVHSDDLDNGMPVSKPIAVVLCRGE